MQEPLDSYFSKDSQNTIAGQNFLSAILLAIFSIILVFSSRIFNRELDIWVVTLLSFFVDFRLLIYLKKYLTNFGASKAIRTIKWVMGFYLVLIIISILSSLNIYFNRDDLDSPDILAAIIYFIAVIPVLIAYIILGISIKNIQNDSVGLLREYGISLIIVPASTLLFSILEIFRPEELFFIIESVISSIPTIILILIFARARKITSQFPNQ